MSAPLQLISSMALTKSNVLKVIDQYEEDLSDYESNLTMKGKTLEFCLKEQATWTAYYSERRSEIKAMVSYLETQVNRVRAQLYIQYNEHHTRGLGERAINTYIDREPEFLDMNFLVLCVQEIQTKYDMLLDAFNKRGFALRDITASRIAAINESVL